MNTALIGALAVASIAVSSPAPAAGFPQTWATLPGWQVVAEHAGGCSARNVGATFRLFARVSGKTDLVLRKHGVGTPGLANTAVVRIPDNRPPAQVMTLVGKWEDAERFRLEDVSPQLLQAIAHAASVEITIAGTTKSYPLLGVRKALDEAGTCAATLRFGVAAA